MPDAVVGDAVPAEWLARMGVPLSPDMKAVRTEAYGGVCALFPVDTGVASWLADRLGHRAAWYSPLHESMAAFRRTEASGDCCFVVYPTQENVYISRYGTAGELSLAEVYPLHGAADMVYYLSELAAGERNISLYIYGDRPVRYTDTLKGISAGGGYLKFPPFGFGRRSGIRRAHAAAICVTHFHAVL